MSLYDQLYGEVASSPAFQDDFDYIKKIYTELLPFDSRTLRKGYRLPDSKKDGYSSIYINEVCHTNNDDKVYSMIHPSVNTLDACFNYAARIFPERDCLGERKFRNGKYDDHFTYETYARVAERRLNIGSGLLHFVKTNEFLTANHNVDDFILTLYSSNRLEWLLTDMACHAFSITSTLLYDTLGPESSKYILELTECPLIACSKDKLGKILLLKSELPLLIGVVCFDDLKSSQDEHFFKEFNDVGIKLVDFKKLESIGELNPQKVTPPTPDSIFTISFTSGTTGTPKGVVLTHKTIAAVMTFNAVHLERPDEHSRIVYSFLPLAHIFERANMNIYMIAGLTVAFPTKDDSALTLIDNMKMLKPGLLVGVPRLYNKLESGIKAKVEESKFLTNIINLKIARQELKDDEKAESYLADKFVISKLRKAVGFDNVKYCITGSAPINPSTVKFLKLALGVGFSQGYGATETCGGCLISDILEKNPGSCGAIGIATQLKLKNLPDLNYFVEKNGKELEEPSGEILLRGPQVFQSYYKDENSTKLSFDDEGWYHTGDVAKVNKNGRLYIVDRVKNFFKLAQGEFIVPEKIENIYLSNNSILSQLYVHGDPTKTHLVGIVGIDKPILETILKKNNHKIPETTEQLLELVNTASVKNSILKLLNNDAIHKNLTGFEKIQNLHIDIEPLKLEHDVITPTLKIKRNKAKTHFKDIIESLYEEGLLIKTLLKL